MTTVAKAIAYTRGAVSFVLETHVADAAPKALERLLQSGSVKLTGLFPEEEDQQAALKRARTIHRKAKENFEERGIETLMLGCGLATWENQKPTWDPRAQELLADGKVAPVIDRSYPLAEVPEAFRYSEKETSRGKSLSPCEERPRVS